MHILWFCGSPLELQPAGLFNEDRGVLVPQGRFFARQPAVVGVISQ
jgi:hypothetical protein